MLFFLIIFCSKTRLVKKRDFDIKIIKRNRVENKNIEEPYFWKRLNFFSSGKSKYKTEMAKKSNKYANFGFINFLIIT